jgi:prolyl-tRNA synthetase
MRGGVKFKDADLLGIPIRITVGQKSLADGNVEIKLRSESESSKVSVEDVTAKIIELVNQLKERLKV